MINVRKLVAGTLAGATALVGVAALATSPGASATATAPDLDYVTVSNDGGVVRVSTQIPGQPLFGASVDTRTGTVCVGFSLQVPFCAGGPISAAAMQDPLGGQPIVTVDSDASDGTVGAYTAIGRQPLLGVRYNALSGQLCAGFSYQVPFCTQVGPISVS